MDLRFFKVCPSGYTLIVRLLLKELFESRVYGSVTGKVRKMSGRQWESWAWT